MLDLVRSELARDASDLRASLYAAVVRGARFSRFGPPTAGCGATIVHARGTALEYLHGILPKDIRAALMGKLEKDG